jgi:hypothetical protein
MFKMPRRWPGIKRMPRIGTLKPLPLSTARIPLPRVAEQTRQELLERHAANVPGASLPERIIWKWLDDNQIVFTWQRSTDGGRLVRGGFVIDFLVFGLAPLPVAIRVQGEYWHGPRRPTMASTDDAAAARLRAQGYLVVDLWEEDIYQASLRNEIGLLIRRSIR